MKMNKKILFLIIFFAAILFSTKVQAGTSISMTPSNPTVGQTVTITVTVSNVTNSDVHVNVSGAGTSAAIDVVQTSSNGELTSFTSTKTVTPTAAGQITAKTTEGSNAVANGEYDQNIKASKSVTVTQVATTNNSNNNNNTNTNNNTTPQKSNNARLSNLGFTPNDFKGFTPNKTSYSATVPNSVSSVNIYANKGQNGQTITGTGKKDLQEGVNQFSIVVTAEDGTTKNTYNLSITREAAKEEEDKTEENEDITNTEETETEEEIKVGLEKLTIDGITLSPSFKKDVYEYTAKLIGDKTKLDISTTAIDEGQIIEVIGNEDLKEGENVITITVQSDDEKETATYQITVNKSLVDEEAIAREKAEAEKQEKEKQQRIIIIAVIVVAIIVVGIILLVRYIKYRNSDEEYFDEDEEDESYYEEMQKPKSLNNIRETADDIINNLGKEEEPESEKIEKEEYKEESYDYQDFEEIERKARKKKSKGKRFKED